jgi:hypothetical protein
MKVHPERRAAITAAFERIVGCRFTQSTKATKGAAAGQ